MSGREREQEREDRQTDRQAGRQTDKGREGERPFRSVCFMFIW